MNKQTKEMQVADIFVQPAKDKHPYIVPRFEAIPVERTSLICTSVQAGQGSTEDDYDDKGDIDNGDNWDINIGY